MRRLVATLYHAFALVPVGGAALAVLPQSAAAQTFTLAAAVKESAANVRNAGSRAAAAGARKPGRAQSRHPLAAGSTTGAAPVHALAVDLAGDSGTGCSNTNGQNCQIRAIGGTGNHSQPGGGPSPNPIAHGFTDPQTLSAGNNVGAIDFYSRGGNGGDADSNGGEGGPGAAGGTVGLVSLASGVTAQGANGGGIVSVVSEGGAGGGGQGAKRGHEGRGGRGGDGGAASVDMNGAINGSDASSPGLHVSSQGGTGGGGSAGKIDFFAAFAGDGGNSGAVTVNVGGGIAAGGTGVQASGIGGTGGPGPDDNAGASLAIGNPGGNGGSAGQTVQVTVAGTVTSTHADGVDATARGGAGGNGGKGGSAPHSEGGAGGAGGSAGTATTTVSGSVQGALAGLSVASRGGAGGNGGGSTGSLGGTGNGGNGGNGGTAGTADATVAAGGSVTGGSVGVTAVAGGGDGGNGGTAAAQTVTGGNGGQGGTGGSAKVELFGAVNGAPQAVATGAYALSSGGAGGAGAAVGGGVASGGRGGNGGSGGSATVIQHSGSTITTTAADQPNNPAVQPGLLARANGGGGGAGGNGFATIGAGGGGAGFGGAGGTATATVEGAVTTSGSFAFGALAQSGGGNGAGGGEAASLFFTHGGKAVNGGHGGTAIANGSGGTITTTGGGAAGLVAQSIGGGGGAAGNALSVAGGIVAIGGNGGAGGDGGAVKVGLVAGDPATAALNDTLITRGAKATGILAQSIGGAGGIGGNATAVGFSPISLGIGGDGKGGGAGGNVSVVNDGLVTTFGAQSGGIAAQSVGGGGGNGGAGVGMDASSTLAIAFTLGGTGAGGGSGGTVALTNNQQVTTYGSDAYGLKAQSLAGGGGEGGTATSVAVALSPNPEVPALSFGIAIGGSGGAGGNQSSSPVSLTNNGFVSTSGGSAFGVFAQSIAGGGGNGGDSTAASYARGPGTKISVSIGGGGNGGASGIGGPVTVDNRGFVMTLGESAHGVMAESVGGGGGVGGVGDSAASTGTGETYGLSGSISVGGQGGKGSQGGLVTITNEGSIATRGDGARAVFAHSVGGGGGASGGGAAKANGQDLSLSVTVGGNAGSGGNGGEVHVTNSASLLTLGADADAIFAQSVGGGGGIAGKGSSTSGGSNNAGEDADSLALTISKGLGIGENVVKIADKVFQVGDGALKGITKIGDMKKALFPSTDSVGDDPQKPDNGEAKNLGLGLTIGGHGGAGGDGNLVKVDSSGSIETDGARSDAVFAQSVGGGGGVGGLSSFSMTRSDTGSKISLGGFGAAAGKGGEVDITHDASGVIVTEGAAARGLFAQSVGGGGGKGGITGSEAGALQRMDIVLGGSGGAGGAGGTVKVDNLGSITTNGAQAFGILAQSTGGGGGTADVLSSGKPEDRNSVVALQLTIGGNGGAGGNGGPVTVTHGEGQGATVATHGDGGIGIVGQSIGGGGGTFVTTSLFSDGSIGLKGATIPITIGGSGGATGNGGAVAVSLGTAASPSAPYVVTSGIDAYAVLAQSVGGGGGLVVGSADPNASIATLFGSAGQTGSGGTVNVSLDNAAWIYTSGAGAVGVLAQSVGGGGGLIGGMSKVDLTSAIKATPVAESGQGGNVAVNFQQGGNIVTTGARAHGVFAQSVGGGGGVLAQADGTGYAFSGANPYTGCSGTACTGTVSVTMGGNTVVRTSGAGAYGIFVQSRGNGVNDTQVNIGAGSYVESWKDSAGGIFVDGAGTNTIVNNGMIDDGTSTNGGARSTAGVAIAGNRPATIQNAGTINGSVILPTGTSTFENLAGGTFNAGPTVDLGALGQLRNSGTMEIGGSGVSSLRVRGDFVQAAGGRTVIDVDSIGRRSDALQVSGSARLAGSLVLRSSTLTPAAITVLRSATTPDPTGLTITDTGGGRLFGYRAAANADGLSVTPYVKLVSAARGDSLGQARVAAAGHLEAGFVEGMSTSRGTLYAQLATLATPESYRSALDSVSGEVLQAVSAAAHATSLGFFERMNSCPTLENNVDPLRERSCGWVRALDNRTHRQSNADSAGYDASTRTVQIGGQTALGGGWLIGTSVAYDDSRYTADASGTQIDGHGFSGGLLVKRELGPWLLSGGVDFGGGRYDSQRSIDIGTLHASATGKFQIDHVGLHGRVAYRLPQDGWYMKPYVDLHAVQMRSSAFDETGAADLDLRVAKQRDMFYTVSPMLELGAQRQLDSGYMLHGFVAAGAVLHDRNQWGAASSLEGMQASGAPGFRATAELPTRRFKLNAGVQVGWKQSELRFEYGGDFGSGYRSQTASVRLSVSFD